MSIHCYSYLYIRKNINVFLTGFFNMTLNITLEFSGGAELLFDNQKRIKVSLEKQEEKWTIRSLIMYINDNLIQERKADFMSGDTVRPGILVLINDEDWELHYKEDYELEEKDVITFISTLHGG